MMVAEALIHRGSWPPDAALSDTGSARRTRGLHVAPYRRLGDRQPDRLLLRLGGEVLARRRAVDWAAHCAVQEQPRGRSNGTFRDDRDAARVPADGEGERGTTQRAVATGCGR